MTPAPTITPSHWQRFHQLAALMRRLGGVGPTVRECAAVWGVSAGTARTTLARLADAAGPHITAHRLRWESEHPFPRIAVALVFFVGFIAFMFFTLAAQP